MLMLEAVGCTLKGKISVQLQCNGAEGRDQIWTISIFNANETLLQTPGPRTRHFPTCDWIIDFVTHRTQKE